MSADLLPFSYGTTTVRVVMIDGEPWFVLSDLCVVLGISNVGNVADRLDEVNVRRADVENMRGQMRQTVVVSEAGMYEVVIRSDKPEAVNFRRWITGTVLPEIRKTGSYSAAPQYEIPQNYAAALRLAADQTERAEAAEAQVRELAVPASAWNELAEAKGDYSVSDAAKVLMRDPNITKIGERRLFDFMFSQRWIYRSEGRWRAYQTQVDCGRLTEKVGRPYVRNGQMHNGDPTVRITPKGLAELRTRLGGSADGAGGQIALVVS